MSIGWSVQCTLIDNERQIKSCERGLQIGLCLLLHGLNRSIND